MAKDDCLELTGEVIDSNKSIFKVKIAENHIITARLGGKIRLNDIRIVVGDKVIVETSVYDTTLGRIVRRIRA